MMGAFNGFCPFVREHTLPGACYHETRDLVGRRLQGRKLLVHVARVPLKT